MRTSLLAWHFLQSNYRTVQGEEPPWMFGETRTVRGEIQIGQSGYHSATILYDAFRFQPGPIACMVRVSDPVTTIGTLHVSASRTLVKAANVVKPLMQFAKLCSARAKAYVTACGDNCHIHRLITEKLAYLACLTDGNMDQVATYVHAVSTTAIHAAIATGLTREVEWQQDWFNEHIAKELQGSNSNGATLLP